MPDAPNANSVAFPAGETASTFLLRLLSGAKSAFPDALGSVSLPDCPGELKKSFGEVLLRFEQRRGASGQRRAIARHVQRHVAEELTFGDDGAPLSALRLGTPFELAASPSSDAKGWQPSLSYRGRRFTGAELGEMLDDLAARHMTSPGFVEAVRRSLAWLEGGRLDLSGERFALLGAGAELAPTEALLDAGAEVLWMDVRPPDPGLASRGALHHARGQGDLLTAPDRIAGTLARFADDGPMHLGLFAYSPGRGREWRLGAAMNAVVRALPPEALRSIGVYVSPTSPALLSAHDHAEALRRWDERAGWQRALVAGRAIRRTRGVPGLPPVCDTVVPLQGLSYQAAQWVEKTLGLEALAAERPELRVSSVVAPITETSSLEHPLFSVAFRGARIFGVEAFAPEVTRTLAALAYLDGALCGDETTGPVVRHFHGGLFVMPFELDGAIRVAAVRGFVSRDTFRRKKRR